MHIYCIVYANFNAFPLKVTFLIPSKYKRSFPNTREVLHSRISKKRILSLRFIQLNLAGNINRECSTTK